MQIATVAKAQAQRHQFISDTIINSIPKKKREVYDVVGLDDVVWFTGGFEECTFYVVRNNPKFFTINPSS